MTISPNAPSFVQYLSDPVFWIGAGAALLVLLVSMGVGGWVVARWNGIIQFRQPAKAVSLPGPGPSGAQRLWTCINSCLLLGIFFLIVAGGLILTMANWDQIRPLVFGR